MDKAFSDLLRAAENDERVLAVILYGSKARGDDTPSSDTDICLVLSTAANARDDAAAVQFDYFRFSSLDIRVFQRLPIYVRSRVLKDGKVLFVRDEDELYEIAFRTVRAFEDFRPFYLEYLKQTANG